MNRSPFNSRKKDTRKPDQEILLKGEIMSYENLSKIMESSGEEIECSSPITEKTICEFERGLDLKFPESYRQFLKTFGFLSFNGEEFYGVTPSGINAKSLPSVYFATLSSRELGDISGDMIKIKSSGYGPNICIDVSDESEGAVYEVPLSYKRDKDKFKLSDSFHEFIYDEILRIVSELNE